MAIPEELLEQAKLLAARGGRRPKQADLRRSVSAAYYGLFHLLVQDAARRMSPSSAARLTQKISRGFSHGEMKQVWKAVQGPPSAILAGLWPQGFSPELRSIAGEFVALQLERHDADYDLSRSYSRVEGVDLLGRLDAAFAVWTWIRRNEEADVFCAALLLNRLWGR